jgi:hypothetical protein
LWIFLNLFFSSRTFSNAPNILRNSREFFLKNVQAIESNNLVGHKGSKRPFNTFLCSF